MDLENNFLIFDGAMGTMLQSKGMAAGDLPEVFNITNPSLLLDIHRSYVEAGSNVVTANTFQANSLKLKHSGYTVSEIITAGVSIAKKSGAKYVALDIGPTGQLLEPIGTLSFDKAVEIYKEQVIAGVTAGADIILIETFSDIYEAKAAILAAKENSNLPVFCTLSFQEDGHTFIGCDAQTAVIALQGLGIDAIGINCSLGPKELLPIVQTFLKYSKIPVMLQPNAGLPQMLNGQTIYAMTPDEFASYMQTMAKIGVKILGGCCGTTPDYIHSICTRLEYMKPFSVTPSIVTAATSGRKTVFLDGGITLIGERINPTGKKKLKEALRSDDFDYVIGEAIDQVSAGADILDVNCGLPEIDEAQALTTAIKEISAVVNAPLQIDSSNVEALSAAARIYNGKPIINSVNGTKDTMAAIFPIVKKYGCLIVCLALDENGIPDTTQGRIAIAEKILETALSYGIPKEDILVDCLVLTASANQKQVLETINSIKEVKSKLGLKTVLGVSNVSFGLPNRSLLNSTFLAAALGAGLDAPILNPLSDEIMSTINAFKVINAQDTDAENFVKRYSSSSNVMPVASGSSRSLQDIIIEGRKSEAENAVLDLMKTMEPLSIIDKIFIPSLDAVGLKYEKNEIFLPQLIRSAETVKNAFTILKENIPTNSNEVSKGSIVLATVKGDIHDIGKNIVKILLENYGYLVIDLGKDVETDAVVDAVIAHNVKLVGLSALMTTTVQSMKATITAIKKSSADCKIMVGGAVLNAEYAELVGADFYAKDAREGISIASQVFGV